MLVKMDPKRVWFKSYIQRLENKINELEKNRSKKFLRQQLMNNSGQEQINSHNCSEQSPFPNKSLCHKIQDIITNIVLYQVETQVNRVELLLESGTASMSIRKDRMVG